MNGLEGENQWILVGASPYLDAVDDTNRVETDVDLAKTYEFTFQNSTYPEGATISTVMLRTLLQGDGDDRVRVYLWDGTTWYNLGTIISPVTYSWSGFDVTSILNSKSKIDSAKVYYIYNKTGKANLLKIDAARLDVYWSRALPHWALTDDLIPDGDTTSIWTSETDGSVYSDLYNAQNVDLPADAIIDSVEVVNHAKAAIVYGDYYPRLYIFIRTYDINYASPVILLDSDVYHDESYVWTLNPATGQPWTEAEINALQIGCRGNSILITPLGIYNTTHVTQVYAIITWHLPISIPRVTRGNGFVLVTE